MTKKIDKMQNVKLALLSRLTDFQLVTNDEEFFRVCEELREYICNFKKGGEESGDVNRNGN